MGPIVAEIFEGPHYGSIFGTITVALIGGDAAGPWVAGIIPRRRRKLQVRICSGDYMLRDFWGSNLDCIAKEGANGGCQHVSHTGPLVVPRRNLHCWLQ